jgi:hypothetical protein
VTAGHCTGVRREIYGVLDMLLLYDGPYLLGYASRHTDKKLMFVCEASKYYRLDSDLPAQSLSLCLLQPP